MFLRSVIPILTIPGMQGLVKTYTIPCSFIAVNQYIYFVCFTRNDYLFCKDTAFLGDMQIKIAF
jgi:hypothetical protein